MESKFQISLASSLAMNAKLSGFRFRMADGILEAMQLESEEVSLK